MLVKLPPRLFCLSILLVGLLSLSLVSYHYTVSPIRIPINWQKSKSTSLESGDGRENALIVILVSPKRIERTWLIHRSSPYLPSLIEALAALRNIEDRLNHRLKYPYVLLTEANITEEIRTKVEWITEGRATFGMHAPCLFALPAS